ncbi:hypothetical protein EN829_014830 [Mesorhizobium sp. M00.F.Ca.ET.186.01.1.1]|nr:hypothetical protein EN848_14605 [bacterium M00.F.Ca.ET.205.01.1.1]TGU52959.1 hypothetical protein EN795_14790 [bacterium M00.F.Ca.ET.152.01.1.1]TGV35929.1 hypothetical protein EN829_014830 [Mesorhizobium sp. M00.F.Ca.ET.186.01.1.1]TGZ43511.1 hypothetical protein EN805_10400 [bacterium M00.F.Ca.ET.162.01.1.1]
MTRSAKRKPVTLDEIEAGLDLVARRMEALGPRAELYLPIWRALERERDKRVEASTILAAARARLARSPSHTMD